jgi:hypothetical protein
VETEQTPQSTRTLLSSETGATPSKADQPKSSLKVRLRYRPVVSSGNSSATASPTQADAHQSWYTPSLASPADSSAEDDGDPVSPSFEISETQNQSSLSSVPAAPASPAPYTVQIPIGPFDKSDYESIKGSSQFANTLTSPARTAKASPRAERRKASPTARTLAEPSSSPDPLSSQSYGPPRTRRPLAKQSPAQIFSSCGLADNRIEIPASLEVEEISSTAASTQAATSAIKESSSAGIFEQSVTSGQADHQDSSQPVSVPSPKSSCPAPVQPGFQHFASTQPQAVAATNSAASTSQGLKPLELPSSPSTFESQLPEVRRRLASPLRFGARPRAQSPLQKLVAINEGRNTGSPNGRIFSTPARMDVPAVRQSPRLQTATPVQQSKSPARATQQNRRARTPQPFDDSNSQAVAASVTSPLATNPPYTADYSSQPANASYLSSQSYPNNAHMGVAPYTTVYDPTVGVSALPIQQSIEEELQSSADSIASKASSSQVSLQNERIVPQLDGISLPVQPVVGPGEYLVGLPAEGKIQSTYTDMINAKKKMVLKFIHRRDSVGSAQGSTSRTMERNEMIDLMEKLQDVTTHMDLGLPGFTQYSIKSEEAATYARYAGSKFGFLGDLLDTMKRVDCGIIIACKAGAVSDLVADFVKLKHVSVRRHDRPSSPRSPAPEASQEPLKVDIVSTTADTDIHLSATPALMIAFDASFDNQNAQIRRLRELDSRGRDLPLPVVHLLVTNSSEHIDRCMRKAMPSPQRLKLLVRGTYLARDYLGGSPSYVPPPPNPDGTPVNEILSNMHDLQRAVRKSPNRKLTSIAATVACAALSADFEENWNINTLPEVQYDELDDTPPKISETTTAAGTAAPTPRDGRLRTRSPASRSNTPSGRKRLLDVDAAASLLAKRQRMTPQRDLTPLAEPSREVLHIEQLQERLKMMAIDLANEKDARARAEESRNVAVEKLAQSEKKLQEWQSDHAGLLRRYEKQRDHNRTLHKENKRLLSGTESMKTQAEKVRETNVKVREENISLKKQLESARDDLKAEGGDIAALEEARSEARMATQKTSALEKSLENTKRDFEFTRQQYQQASNSAADLGNQNTELEAQIETLKAKASGEQRRLKEMNAAERSNRDREEFEKLSQESRAMLIMMRKLDEENKTLKKTRGVQTRGSSAQPPGSPGVGAAFGRRSRQNSPAVGGREDRLTVPGSSGNTRDRVSAVRNEP